MGVRITKQKACKDTKGHLISRVGQAAAKVFRDEAGQSTVEFALICVAFLAVVIALLLLWGSARDAVLIKHYADAVSHSDASVIEEMQDVLLY